ncbi:MAG: response regulator [Crocinitomix sp.]|nr:response regulator [Crocinitomix sp.]
MNSQKYSALIVEDELLIADNIQAILENEGISVCGIAMTYEKALYLIQTHQPDIVLLDIQLKTEKTGIDVAKWMLKNVQIPLLFLTSQENEPYVTNAFETAPIAYIIKPISASNLVSTLKLALFQQSQKEQSNFVKLKVGDELIPVELNTIIYLQSDHIYINVHTTNAKYLVRSSMENLLLQFGSSFIQSHRSYALNKLFIEKISSSYVTLTNGEELPVSRKFRNDLKNMAI